MKKNWRTASIVGIVLLCIGAALVAAAALRGMRAAKGTDLPVQAPPVSEAAQAGTRPLAAAASWSPAARPG
ncbi:MAG: hypothetical protein FWC27_04030, partial [Firmicutes bacterium]|nr:hypothetical protein [Bacillota bacterium]